MFRVFYKIFVTLCASVLFASVTGCSTGIESTRAIKMSGAEKRASMPTPEDEFISPLAVTPLARWESGAHFLVVNDKVRLLFDSALSDFALSDSITGTFLIYEGVLSKRNPDGLTQAVVSFHTSDGRRAVFPTGLSPEDAGKNLTNVDIPMLIDLGLVVKADSMLRGRRLWTRSSLWYDAAGNVIPGRKFEAVTVDSVIPGNEVFPLTVCFAANGGVARIPMNVGNGKRSLAESRVFQNLFMLSDPRPRYSSISDANWECICSGKVASGMTKEEVRLSIGNPQDVDAGHDWSRTLDIWKYPDGRCLLFEDGLLTKVIH